MEEIEKNIEAIEEEKKEYLEEHPESPSDENKEDNEEYIIEEDTEIEVTEMSLSDVEIEEWIAKLKLLQASKEPINLEIDEETELSINYEEEEE